MVYGSDRDLRAFCRLPHGVPVSFRATSTYGDGEPVCGLLDRPTQIKLMDSGIGGIETSVPELRLPCNAFQPMPVAGDTLVVDGSAYTVNQPTAEDDGAFLVYELFST